MYTLWLRWLRGMTAVREVVESADDGRERAVPIKRNFDEIYQANPRNNGDGPIIPAPASTAAVAVPISVSTTPSVYYYYYYDYTEAILV